MPATRTVAILLFPGIELLDFAGPFEVFATAGRLSDPAAFVVATVAERPGPVLTRDGLSVNPGKLMEDCSGPDVLIVPGGPGSRAETENTILIDWIRRTATAAEVVLSVCTGALLLGKAGLLDGLAATTHHGAIDLLRQLAPLAAVREGDRAVDNGRVVTSGGISAGIDAALHVVAKLLGSELASRTARHLEYPWQPDEPEVRIQASRRGVSNTESDG